MLGRMHLSVMAKILDYNTLVFMCSFVTGSSLMLFVCYPRTHTHTCIPLRICTQKHIFLSIPIFCTIKRMCSTDKQNLWFAQCSLRNRLLFKGKFFKWCIKMHRWCISLPFTEMNIKTRSNIDGLGGSVASWLSQTFQLCAVTIK